MLFLDKDFWSLLKLNRVLVIFDEIHHCAGQSIDNSNSWGEEIICNIQDYAAFTLALSGTPWRSDKAPIVMARYSDPEGDIQCNYVYGLKEATLENVCRLPNIVLVDNEQLTISMSDSSETTFNNLQDLLSGSDITYQDVISNVKAMQHLLALAVCRLNEIRRVNPEAGGLIVASSVQHAQSILQILHSVFVQSAVLVTYKDPKSAESIELFRDSSTQWIVSVGMVSEGTDIPRLQVCCHLSRIRTELYFRQILGRILRVNSALNQEAWLYVFAEPQLSEFAMRLKNDVPDSQVIFDTRKKIDINKCEELNQLITKSSHPTDVLQQLVFNSMIKNSSPLFQDSLTLYDHSHPKILSFLGRFQEKIINIFDSPSLE